MIFHRYVGLPEGKINTFGPRNAPKNETEIRTAEVRSSEPPGQQEHSGIVELQCSHLCFHLPEQIRFLEKDMIGRPSWNSWSCVNIASENEIEIWFRSAHFSSWFQHIPPKNIHKTIGWNKSHLVPEKFGFNSARGEPKLKTVQPHHHPHTCPLVIIMMISQYLWMAMLILWYLPKDNYVQPYHHIPILMAILW